MCYALAIEEPKRDKKIDNYLNKLLIFHNSFIKILFFLPEH
jgi:hypothetical protein